MRRAPSSFPPPLARKRSEGARSPCGAPPRHSRLLPLDPTPGRASWNHRMQTGEPSPAPVQRAPRGPITRRTGRCPEPPQAGYEPARGYRSRSVSRPSPVDALRRARFVIRAKCNGNGDLCQGGSHNKCDGALSASASILRGPRSLSSGRPLRAGPVGGRLRMTERMLRRIFNPCPRLHRRKAERTCRNP